MKLSDYVVDFLVNHGIQDIFLVSGGGIAHLLDSIGQQPKIRYYCNYHEQACAVAAEGYARVSGKVGACLVTWGPGAVNALAGILGAWVDSIPVLVISGQVRSDLIADYTKLRQKGPQEGNVLDMAKHVTKYSESIRDPRRIRYALEKALYEATNGRPGPVWVELPFDIQGAIIDATALEPFRHEPALKASSVRLATNAGRVLEAIRSSERPIIVAGNGIRLAGCMDLFMRFLEQWPIPVTIPFSAKDIIPECHPMNMGVFGTNGQRRANFAIQNADLLISFGAGLCVTKVGFNYNGFAPKARKIIVDIDPNQIEHQVPKADLAVEADLKPLLAELLRQGAAASYRPNERWLDACSMWKRCYPIILDEYVQDREFVNMYVFMDRLADALAADDVIVTGNGFDVVSCYQAFKVKEGQRVIVSGNWGSMGWDLPLAVGGCIARGGKRTIVTCGDGSIQWNIQELLTVQHYHLPVKIFVFNNRGYNSIRATQQSLFGGRLVGADPGSGVASLNFTKLADLYGFNYTRIANNAEIARGVQVTLAGTNAAICDVNISPNQMITPKASAFRRPNGTIESRPLEDMSPFLSREEIRWNMHLFDDGVTSKITEPPKE